MADIKPLADVAEKYARVTPERAVDYEKGIAAPRRDWAKATVASEDAYKAGVTAAATAGRFGKGVVKAGTGKWQSKALQKGPGRFREGVATAGPDYTAGFEKYHKIIANLVLPARYPKGDPRNIQRVVAVADALHKAKMAA